MIDEYGDRVTYLGTGIGTLPAAKRYLRDKWRQAPMPAIVSRPGARFYVTIRHGASTGFLLGPYVSHLTALANVPRARRMAYDARPDEAVFAAFGTASLPVSRTTRFGR
jgi:hypothetical protein